VATLLAQPEVMNLGQVRAAPAMQRFGKSAAGGIRYCCFAVPTWAVSQQPLIVCQDVQLQLDHNKIDRLCHS